LLYRGYTNWHPVLPAAVRHALTLRYGILVAQRGATLPNDHRIWSSSKMERDYLLNPSQSEQMEKSIETHYSRGESNDTNDLSHISQTVYSPSHHFGGQRRMSTEPSKLGNVGRVSLHRIQFSLVNYSPKYSIFECIINERAVNSTFPSISYLLKSTDSPSSDHCSSQL
jgi:hypothetical protein